ncbi:MAG: alpha/beta fold hydrolase BchO [Pseudomonadota bacterium]
MIPVADAPDWSVEGRSWPHRAHSRFVDTRSYHWRVEQMGEGPPAVLIHGVGASAHSWAGLAPLLATSFSVTAFDLPGHGFTRARRSVRPSLENVARETAGLLRALDIEPELMIGHSAGSAIMLRMLLDKAIASEAGDKPRLGVSINGALEPFGGAAAFLFPFMARALYLNPLTAHFFARTASDRARVERLIAQTGTTPSRIDVERYALLLARAGHVSGALRMMANWELDGLTQDLRRIETPLLFLAGAGDKATPASVSERAAAAAPNGRFSLWPSVGHLAHEEDPVAAHAFIMEAYASVE